MARLKRKSSKWQMGGPVAASEAKAHFLELISTVDENSTELVITKRGKPVAKLIPFRKEKSADTIFGCMKGTFEITGDVISPEPDVWDAMR